MHGRCSGCSGASVIVHNHNYREAPWAHYHKVVDDLMAGYEVPKPG